MSNSNEIRINDKIKSGYALIITGILFIVIFFYLFYILISTILSYSSFLDVIVSFITKNWWINIVYPIICIFGLIIIRLGQILLKNRYALIDNDSIRFFIPSFLGHMKKIEYKWAQLERMEVHRGTIIEYSTNELWLMYEEVTEKFPLYDFTKKASIEILKVLKKFAEKKQIRFISEIKLSN
ncbi:MAG: hypothetical protein ACFE75_07785 [Candidatus Hodarchaeota archaeon]